MDASTTSFELVEVMQMSLGILRVQLERERERVEKERVSERESE